MTRNKGRPSLLKRGREQKYRTEKKTHTRIRDWRTNTIQMYLQIIMNGKYNIILECENGKHLSPTVAAPKLAQLILSW